MQRATRDASRWYRLTRWRVLWPDEEVGDATVRAVNPTAIEIEQQRLYEKGNVCSDGLGLCPASLGGSVCWLPVTDWLAPAGRERCSINGRATRARLLRDYYCTHLR
eukprot:COSAG06_NODE_13731_length_1224_cov_5.186667_3_plen_107_part_00